MKTILIAFISFSLCGCIWVDLSDEASNVRVLESDQLEPACVQTGTTHVEVLNKFILERAASNVMLELQALARNQATERGDDTVVATTVVMDGEQDYALYRCIPE